MISTKPFFGHNSVPDWNVDRNFLCMLDIFKIYIGQIVIYPHVLKKNIDRNILKRGRHYITLTYILKNTMSDKRFIHICTCWIYTHILIIYMCIKEICNNLGCLPRWSHSYCWLLWPLYWLVSKWMGDYLQCNLLVL